MEDVQDRISTRMSSGTYSQICIWHSKAYKWLEMHSEDIARWYMAIKQDRKW